MENNITIECFSCSKKTNVFKTQSLGEEFMPMCDRCFQYLSSFVGESKL